MAVNTPREGHPLGELVNSNTDRNITLYISSSVIWKAVKCQTTLVSNNAVMVNVLDLSYTKPINKLVNNSPLQLSNMSPYVKEQLTRVHFIVTKISSRKEVTFH